MTTAWDIEQAIVACIPALRRYALALTRNASEVDDLVQETLSRALAMAHRYDRARPIAPWLLKIEHSLFVTDWRRRRRERAMPPDGVVAGDLPLARQEVRQVLECLMALPEDQRQVVALIALEELSYAEAAEVLGIPRGTLMSRLARGRQALREALDRPAARLRVISGDRA